MPDFSRATSLAELGRTPGPHPQWGGLAGLGRMWNAIATSPSAQSLIALAKHPAQVYAGAADPYDTAKAVGLATAPMMGGVGLTTAGKAGVTLGAGPIRQTPGFTYWSDLAKTKHPIPVEQMSATRVPTEELLPRATVSPESLQGSVLIPAYGDRTAAGVALTHINERPLADPVRLEGGPDFMRAAAAQKEGSAWASGKGKVTTLAGRVRDAAKEGDPVNLVYSAMGARGGDFSTMMADAVLGQLPGAKVTNRTAQEFDAAMKAQRPDWPGLKSPDLRGRLRESAGLRKTFVDEMALGKWQDAGFPDVGSTRAAISEPALLGQQTGASGYAISQLDPRGRVISNPAVPHTTYDTHLGGLGYLGGLERSVPREIMFPDWWATRQASPNQHPTAHNRSFEMGDVRQKADQQWLDRVMAYLSQGRGAVGAQ
jgi:hypothetical protein